MPVSGPNHHNYIDGECNVKTNRFYRTYRNILQRCNNPKFTGYKNYGGRGVKCLFKSYEHFKEVMYESYLLHVSEYGEKDTSIERNDCEGNYEPCNCSWETRRNQARNRRNSIAKQEFVIDGAKRKMQEIADQIGIKPSEAAAKLESGWSIDDLIKNKRTYDMLEVKKAERNYKEEKQKIMELFKRSTKIVSTYLSVLDSRERQIIEMRFGLKTGKRMTLQEIGEVENCTRERIRQIEAKAMEKMLRFYSELAY